MAERNYQVIAPQDGLPIKLWINGVAFDENSREQLVNVAKLPFIYKWIAVMPDVHYGKGATIGSVIPTIGAIIPAAVGVDIGCGMMAVKTSLNARDLPSNLKDMRDRIEEAVPHGRKFNRAGQDNGSWKEIPSDVGALWESTLVYRFNNICEKHPKVLKTNNIKHLGTLGTGNHFVEVCLDTENNVWIMLHSGSRGVGNFIGEYFISLAKEDMRKWLINLPDKDLAYLPEGTEHFEDYVEAVEWAQDFAMLNRQVMMKNIIQSVKSTKGIPEFTADLEVVNCHHNYIAREHHYDKDVFVTRKGAVRAREGDLAIIPGSMGAKSYIVRGKGNPESFHSCSHGAGRVMSRGEAVRKYTVDDHIRATDGVECRKDANVIDETPMAYKPIDKVMEAQKDLVDIVVTLKQVVCVKG